MNRTAILFAGLMLLACGGKQSAQTAVDGLPVVVAPESSPSAKQIVDDNLNITLPSPNFSVKNKPIPGFTKGINIGNALEAPSLGEWGVLVTEKHFVMAKKAGLDHIRLPARFSAHAQKQAPYTIDPEFWELVDFAVDSAEKHQMGIIVDLHHYEEMAKNPKDHIERFKAIWKQIAERYKNRSDKVAFELINEPCGALTIDILNPLMKETLEVVRASNPNRIVFIDCYFWANTEWLDDMDVSFFDENTVATFHMYQPILFTHQGAPWMDAEYQVAQVIFPGPPAKPVEITGPALSNPWSADWLKAYNTLDAKVNPSGPKTVWEEFDRATAFVEKNGIRVYMGEFGAIDFADARSRTIFLKMVRKESERRGIGWAYWDDGGHNRAVDLMDETWVKPVADALFED
ncbi:MAG: glycoside hydrolase family 5 protein [Deltaproteobacteria bacterium]|nr:glycoside hydrolase family 5 protein [Deltaproteobacteria bacterium]